MSERERLTEVEIVCRSLQKSVPQVHESLQNDLGQLRLSLKSVEQALKQFEARLSKAERKLTELEKSLDDLRVETVRLGVHRRR